MWFMRFGYVELFSQNLPEAAAWWEETMGAIIINERADQVWLALGDTEILLRCDDGAQKSGMRLVLYSDDATDDRSRLKEGGTRTQDSEVDDTFLVQDIDGRWHAVLEQPM
jgi:catechol-2,3-dioxygenase